MRKQRHEMFLVSTDGPWKLDEVDKVEVLCHSAEDLTWP
jgi:hypothetical protein